ncbi:MAG: hypothetical protein ABFS24_13750 [Pseudomonadota bacterium]
MIMLAEPWSDLRQKVEDDRGFAEAVAETLECVDGAIDLCKDVLECLAASQRWMGVALACREYMKELLESAKQEVQS